MDDTFRKFKKRTDMLLGLLVFAMVINFATSYISNVKRAKRLAVINLEHKRIESKIDTLIVLVKENNKSK